MMRLILTAVMLSALRAFSATPAFTDFDTNQFANTGAAHKVSIKSGAAVTNVTSRGKMTADMLTLYRCDLGTIVNGATASIGANTNLYYVVASGATWTIDLPAVPDFTNSPFVNIQGTNTSGGTQVVTLNVTNVTTPIMRDEIGLAVSTITNGPGAHFTYTFDSAQGIWSTVQAVGDALTFGSASGWFKSGTTNSTLPGIGSANDLIGSNTVTAAQFIGIGASKGYWDFFTLNPTNKVRVTIDDNGFGSDYTDTFPMKSGTFLLDTTISTNTTNFLRQWNPLTLPVRYVIEGDSHSVFQYVSQTNWTEFFKTKYADVWGWTLGTNAAASSDTATNMFNTYTAQVHPYAPSGGTNAVLFCFAGGNDIVLGATAQTAWNSYSNLIATAKADGFFVVGGTYPDSGTAGSGISTVDHARLRNFNIMARSSYDLFDRFVDYDQAFCQPGSITGPEATVLGTTDGIHETTAQARLTSEAVAFALVAPVRPPGTLLNSYRQFDILDLNGGHRGDQRGLNYKLLLSGSSSFISFNDITLTNAGYLGVYGGTFRMGFTNGAGNLSFGASEFLAASNSVLYMNWPIHNIGVGVIPVEGQLVTINRPLMNQSPIDGLFITNSTPAALGVQQYSPSIYQIGNGWGTTAGTSQPIAFRTFILPNQSTAAAGTYTIQSSYDNAAFVTALGLTGGGSLTVPGTVTAGASGNFAFTGRSKIASTADGSMIIASASGSLVSTLQANIPQITKTANYTILVSDSGLRFCNIGAGTTNRLDLPTAAANLHYWMTVVASQNMQIQATAGDVIHEGSTAGAANGDIHSSTPYSSLHIFSLQAGHWIVEGKSGTWVGPE